MLDRIKRLFASPIFKDDEDRTRIASLLHIMLFSMFVIGLIFVPIGALIKGSYPGLLIMLGILSALVPGVLLMLRRGHVGLVSVLLVSLLFVATIASVSIVGSIRVPVASLFILCVVIAALLFGHRGTVVVTVLSLVALLGLWWAETAGLLSPYIHGAVGFASWLTLAVLLISIAVLLILATRSLNGALERVRRSEKALIESNRQLKAEIAERTRVQAQFLQAQKMEAVGRLAGGVAHDFNNMLTIIIGYADLLLKYFASDEPKRADLEQIRRAADRATVLTLQLLAFSRKQVLQPKVLDLSAVLADIEKMLRRLIGEDIELVTILGPEIGRVQADQGQIEQVIMNLVINARDAMPAGGRLTIETANVDLDETYVREHIDAQPGRYVMLAVSDTGIGMDKKTQSHLFEPFFTTKERGKGTGLGLSTVYGIVKQSRGSIYVYSESGKGTTFKVYLPWIEEMAEMPQSLAASTVLLKGSETILLVEDEDMVRDLARRILLQSGYTVLEARDADEAIQLCARHSAPIHLMMTDVVLPGGMSGPDLAKHLKTSRPEIKVLYVSGYTDNAIVHHGVLDPGVAFLQKPFTPEALALKVRKVLDT